VIARGHKHERKEPARKRLGLVAQPLVDSATPFFGQEDTATIVSMVQVVTASPPRSALLKEREITHQRVAFPCLCLNFFALFVGDSNYVLFAATSTRMAVPVLDKRQISQRE
jgi:hypothetical protein